MRVDRRALEVLNLSEEELEGASEDFLRLISEPALLAVAEAGAAVADARQGNVEVSFGAGVVLVASASQGAVTIEVRSGGAVVANASGRTAAEALAGLCYPLYVQAVAMRNSAAMLGLMYQMLRSLAGDLADRMASGVSAGAEAMTRAARAVAHAAGCQVSI